MNEIDVTIITPFYKGNEYIERLFRCINENAKHSSNLNIELIIVNDSPEVEVKYQAEWCNCFELKIITNQHNLGIQRSRINGIKEAKGKYVILLDQDDLLTNNAIQSQMDCIDEADIVIANGIDQNPNNSGYIYCSMKHQSLAMEQSYYYAVGNMIVSPGQCLIKKSSIPHLWLENIVEHNGSDDLLLWLLMFYNECKWTVNPQVVYTHINTGENVSADLEKMQISSMEVLNILKKYNIVSKKDEDMFVRRLNMKKKYEGESNLKKMMAFFLYPDIAYKIIQMKIK